MFSGYIQSAAYKNLDGVNGLAGWRWLFIICGCITIPIALIGFVVFPSRPTSRIGGYFLTKADRELATSRLIGQGSEAPALKLNLSVFKKIFTSWHWYGFVALYIIFDQAVVIFTGPFGLYLKAHKDTYSISQINNIPTSQAACAILAALIGAYWADASGRMWPPLVVIMSVT
jgi:ACS family pantothenate transporter-like MFS transporter